MKLIFPFRRLRTGLVLTYLALIVTSLGLFAWRVGSSLDASRFAETERDQQGRAILAASGASDWLASYREGALDVAALQEQAATLAREINQPITVLDPRGIVLVDSQTAGEAGVDESSLPEVQTAASGQPGTVIRFDPDDNAEALFSVAPVRFQGNLVGIIRLELQMSLIREASSQLWIRIVGAAALAAALTAVVSLWFAKTLSDPIAAITRAAAALADGDLKRRVHVAGPEELTQLAHSFNFMADRVSDVMEDQRGFVANAAHELRTPLTTIRLRADALADGAKDDPALATQFLTDISSETERLSRLVDELLALSRIETGLVPLERERISVGGVAHGVVDELMPRALQMGIALQIDCPDAPPVYANPDQIRQVFINLLGNAIKFTPRGGRVSIQVQPVRALQSSERLDTGYWLVTRVSDTGVGIPAEDLPHVFDRFYRSDKARARDTGGAGLGLAIAKSVVDQHGGRIWAESEPNRGTVISFALPIVEI
jgi:two-component system, OmpR family, sensor kinase